MIRIFAKPCGSAPPWRSAQDCNRSCFPHGLLPNRKPKLCLRCCRNCAPTQAEIYARSGVELERSTLAGWVGGASRLLAPLVEALRRYVMAAAKLHADDTPVPVLAPGQGQTKTGRLWAYVRDDRP